MPKPLLKIYRGERKKPLSTSMVSGTAYLSHISDLPSCWCRERAATNIFFHEVVHWLDSHLISQSLQLSVCMCVNQLSRVRLLQPLQIVAFARLSVHGIVCRGKNTGSGITLLLQRPSSLGIELLVSCRLPSWSYRKSSSYLILLISYIT